jgi:hypothetical protein
LKVFTDCPTYITARAADDKGERHVTSKLFVSPRPFKTLVGRKLRSIVERRTRGDKRRIELHGTYGEITFNASGKRALTEIRESQYRLRLDIGSVGLRRHL